MNRKLWSINDHRVVAVAAVVWSLVFAVGVLAPAFLSGCSSPLGHAKQVANASYRSLVVTRDIVESMKTSSDERIREAYPEAAKLWNQFRLAALLYTNAVQTWETAGKTPANYEEILQRFNETNGALMNFLLKVGVLK